MAWSDEARRAAAEARKGGGAGGKKVYKPLPGHPYHSKSDAELRFIQKDASEAGRNAQEMGNERGVNKYADQVNDASTVLGYRARSGAGPDVTDRQAANALASGPKSSAVEVHPGASGFERDRRQTGAYQSFGDRIAAGGDGRGSNVHRPLTPSELNVLTKGRG